MTPPPSARPAPLPGPLLARWVVRASEVLLRILNGSLLELDRLARERQGVALPPPDEARQKYEQIKDLLGREMLDQRFAGATGARLLADLPAQVARLNFRVVCGPTGSGKSTTALAVPSGSSSQKRWISQEARMAGKKAKRVPPSSTAAQPAALILRDLTMVLSAPFCPLIKRGV